MIHSVNYLALSLGNEATHRVSVQGVAPDFGLCPGRGQVTGVLSAASQLAWKMKSSKLERMFKAEV